MTRILFWAFAVNAILVHSTGTGHESNGPSLQQFPALLMRFKDKGSGVNGTSALVARVYDAAPFFRSGGQRAAAT